MSKLKALDRGGLMKRKITRDIMLDDENMVIIQALPAAVLLQAAENPDSLTSGLLLVKSIIDQQGIRIFNDDETDVALGCLDNMAVRKLMDSINELNGFKEDSAGEAEKN